MQGLVPGERTIPAYPITIGSPDGAALIPVDGKQSVSESTATTNKPNFNLFTIILSSFFSCVLLSDDSHVPFFFHRHRGLQTLYGTIVMVVLDLNQGWDILNGCSVGLTQRFYQ
jgi:hypothetical protein